MYRSTGDLNRIVGRGKQVIAVARTADCVVMQVEAHKADYQIPKLTLELEAVGIRLNQVLFRGLTVELFGEPPNDFNVIRGG